MFIIPPSREYPPHDPNVEGQWMAGAKLSIYSLAGGFSMAAAETLCQDRPSFAAAAYVALSAVCTVRANAELDNFWHFREEAQRAIHS